MRTLAERRLTRLLLALASGAMIALAFPKANLSLLAFFGVAPLIIAATKARTKLEAFLLGTAAISLTWLINVPWIMPVMSKYGGLPPVVGFLIYVAMCIYLGVYGGLFALAIRLANLRSSFAPWLVVPLAWAAMEFGRTHLLTGFPWNLLAVAIVDYTPFAIASRLIGPYGVGALLVVPSAALAWMLVTQATRKQKVLVASATIAFLLIWGAAGAMYVRRSDAARPRPDLAAAIIQPNITQQMRWDSGELFTIFERMAEMTSSATTQPVTAVIWPESTIPLAYERTVFWREYVEQLTIARKADIILGSVAEDPDDDTKIWNAAFLVANGTSKGRYDKMRLVPFGEYVPVRKFLFFAEKLVRAVGEFQFGTNDKPLVGRLKYGPAICYEVVFPRLTATQVNNGADVLVTITNDAWFDVSAAPPQHLNSARLRALEADRYMLRAATTGISASIDPMGRIVESLPLGKQGIIRAEFSARQSITPYVRFGDWAAWLSAGAALLILIARRKVKPEDE